MSYDEADITRLIDGLDKGNPNRDAEARALLKRIYENQAASGLSAETLTRIGRALKE